MGWLSEAGEDWPTEPVIVESPKLRLPRLEQPESAMAPATRPPIATAFFNARRETRELIILIRTRLLNTSLNLGG